MSTATRGARSVRLPGEPASVPAARRFVAQLIDGLEAELQETAIFLVSEVVTNAVLHARTHVTLRCTVESGGVLVEVADENRQVPLPRRHDEEAVTGRGLEMVELLATGFGVACSGGGKTVWFTVGPVTTRLPAGWSSAADEDGFAVRLLSIPVELYDVLQQHNEAVLREYELILLATGADPVLRRDAADAARVRALIVDAIRRAAAAVPGAQRVDVPLRLPAVEARGVALLPAVLDRAEQAARRGELLARPALPELLELRAWLYAEIDRQLAGQAPQRWGSVSTHLDGPGVPEVDADLSWVAATPHPVVVADDANRIVAVSNAAAELLLWATDELVGHRVTVIVPPRLREAHVAGFTRQLMTGQGRLIGHETQVPALRSDGSEVTVALRLMRQDVGDRTLFVAELLPLDSDAWAGTSHVSLPGDIP